MAYTDNFNTELIGLVTDMVSAEKMQMSEMLYNRAFGASDLATQHEILPGVRSGHVVPILNNNPNPDSFPFVDPTVCAPNECDVDNQFSSMKWELGLIECRVPICLRSFDENFLKFFNEFRQTEEGTPNLDSGILQFISNRFVQNLVIAKWRAAYFADKDSLNPLYNGINGFFAQAEARPDNVIPIAQNDGIGFTEQQFASGENVYNILIAMYEKASITPWFDPANLEYRVTRTMAAKLITWLNRLGINAPGTCDCINPNAATARPTFGLQGLTINGIPILVHQEWDLIINGSTELNGGTTANAPRTSPHRAILTYRNNLLIGTSLVTALESFDIWYSKDDKKVYMEGSSYLGAAIPLDEYVIAI